MQRKRKKHSLLALWFLVLLHLLATFMVMLGDSLWEKTEEFRNSWNRNETIEKTTAGLTEIEHKQLVKNYDAKINCAGVKGQTNRKNTRKQNGRFRVKSISVCWKYIINIGKHLRAYLIHQPSDESCFIGERKEERKEILFKFPVTLALEH